MSLPLDVIPLRILPRFSPGSALEIATEQHGVIHGDAEQIKGFAICEDFEQVCVFSHIPVTNHLDNSAFHGIDFGASPVYVVRGIEAAEVYDIGLLVLEFFGVILVGEVAVIASYAIQRDGDGSGQLVRYGFRSGERCGAFPASDDVPVWFFLLFVWIQVFIMQWGDGGAQAGQLEYLHPIFRRAFWVNDEGPVSAFL